ncbi:MAG: efflux RND transporter permease subunit [Pirellulales bacterium]|nr:efflux RND transporter permease subunit [Pirellulales bacterium]
MLNAVIRFSLQNRLLLLAATIFLLVFGAVQTLQLPIDVFPDLNRPRVVIMAEAPGMAPEEVETLISFPLETALNGATGVQEVRSSSAVGLAVVNVEFDWGTDILDDRQVVNERMSMVADRMPEGIRLQLAPTSSIMGQIQVVGLVSDGAKTSPMELRTLADWVVRQRLLTIRGVSQISVMGGERKQLQALVNPQEMLRYGVTWEDIREGLRASNQNSAGGYLDQQGPNEVLVRSLGRVKTVHELGRVVVKSREGQSVLLSQVARVVEGPEKKRGDSVAYQRNASGAYEGGAAVVLTITKQPGADTRKVTDDVNKALAELATALPADVRVMPDLYEQKSFIDMAIRNVLEALRDGGILVVIILFLFLMNVRTTLITLLAIPLSLVVTTLVFAAFGMSINTMTLGGLAVAIGELVDDAIVDVENIFRRLRENRHKPRPIHPLQVVFQASAEVRNSIVYSTVIVVLVFVPLFALSGMEGRLFTPLAVAYIVSILASLVVSLTVTPVFSYWLLGNARLVEREKDGLLLRVLKWVAERVIRFSLKLPIPVLAATAVGVLAAGVWLLRLDRDFLPPFNEGAVQINVVLPPGASLAKTMEVSAQADQRLQQLEDIESFVRRTGRAELDEHVMDVNVSEIIATIDPDTRHTRQEVIDEISEALAVADIPGIVTSVEQPLAHLISHMLSGVKAQVAVKLYGDDLDELRRQAEAIKKAIADVPGVRDLQVEQQTLIPQLRIEADGHELERHGLRRLDVNELVALAMQGEVVSEVLDGQRTFDLVMRLDEPHREDVDALRRLVIHTPTGGQVKLEDVARIYMATGPNAVSREQVRRRIVVQCNVSNRGLVDVVEEIKSRLRPLEKALPTGYFVTYGGQFESEQTASRTIGVLFVVSLIGIFLVLFKMFRTVNLSLQVMAALPMAFIGAVAALVITGQTLTVAAMVGFIALVGIASRNGILLLNHYLHLVKYEGEGWTKEMIIRGGLERLAPVLMTALCAGIALIPLTLAAGEPGRELLYPVATVIVGGLVSSTLLDFFVHPALFWTLGLNAARRVVEAEEQRVPLVDVEEFGEAR